MQIEANFPMTVLYWGNCKFAVHQGKTFAAAFVKVSIYSLIDSLESGEGLEFYMYIPKSVKAPAFCSLCGGELINKTKTFCHHAIHTIFPLHPKY